MARPEPPGIMSRVSARLRIVGWIVLTAAVGLTGLIQIVDRAMQADVARRANAQVERELAEFRRFAADNRDPATAAPFASVDRLFEVYLARKQAADTELILAGWNAMGGGWSPGVRGSWIASTTCRGTPGCGSGSSANVTA